MERLEKWLPIKGYEGLYEISDLGRVRSLDRTVVQKHYSNSDAKHTYKGREIKPTTRGGVYLVVGLTKNHKQTTHSLHRLVAEHFIPKECGKPFINHKDANPHNNKVENLEWCTQSYNIQYAYDTGRKTPPHEKRVAQLSLNGTFIREYKSLAEAGRKNNIYPQNIRKVCKGERNQAGGYKWQYTE